MKHFILLLFPAMLCAGCLSASTVHEEGPAETPATPVPASFERLRPGVWIHTSYRDAGRFGRVRSNGLVVASGGEALLVNTAWGEDPDSSTVAVLRDVARTSGAQVRRAVVTHFHDDSVAGIGSLRQAGIPTYATALTADLMIAEGWGRADSVFTDGGDAWTLRYGDQEVEVFFAGPGHTVDNVVVYVPSARVLFGGCLIRPGESEGPGNTADADIEAWANTVARVQERYRGRVDVVIPTHGAPGGPELLDHTIRVVETYRRRGIGE